MNALKVFGARGITMVFGLVCGFLTTNIVIGDAGVDAYAAFSFLIALPALIPFTDLGTGAALVNVLAATQKKDSSRDVRRTMLSVVRILFASSLILLAVNALLLVSGAWSIILGSLNRVDHAELAAYVCVNIFAVSVPVAIGSRIFLGLEKAHLLVLFQGVQPPLTLGFVFLATTIDPGGLGVFLSFSAYSALILVAILGLWGAYRYLPRSIAWSYRRAFAPKVRGHKVMDIGVPLLVQTIASPIATQLDRVILAQVVTSAALAEYSLGAQVFFAAQSMFSVVGLTLWPMYVRQKSAGVATRPFLWSGSFALVALLCFGIVSALGTPLFALLSGGRIEVQGTTLAAFGMMLVVQAALYPLGMFLMDKAGARFQTGPVLVMVVVNVTLSVVLARTVGLPGPMIATAIATMICQIIPYSIFILVNRRREQAS